MKHRNLFIALQSPKPYCPSRLPLLEIFALVYVFYFLFFGRGPGLNNSQCFPVIKPSHHRHHPNQLFFYSFHIILGCQGGLCWIIHPVRSRHINKSAALSLSLSFPTSHFLCMLSLANTWLLRIEKKIIFDPGCCLCNKHQRWERSQSGPVETRKREGGADGGKRGCWHKHLTKKWQATWDFAGVCYNLIFLRHLNHILLWPPKWLDELRGTRETVYYQINTYDLRFLFPPFISVVVGQMKTETGSRGQPYFKAPIGAPSSPESSPVSHHE